MAIEEMFAVKVATARMRALGRYALAGVLEVIIKGSGGSGNWAHTSTGRKGKVGGSDPGGGLQAIGVAADSTAEERRETAGERREQKEKLGPAPDTFAGKVLDNVMRQNNRPLDDRELSEARDLADSMLGWVRDHSDAYRTKRPLAVADVKQALDEMPEHWKEPGMPLGYSAYGYPLELSDIKSLLNHPRLQAIQLLSDDKPLPWWRDAGWRYGQ